MLKCKKCGDVLVFEPLGENFVALCDCGNIVHQPAPQPVEEREKCEGCDECKKK